MLVSCTKKQKLYLLITGMRRNSLSLVMYFNIFNPLDIGRSTSERIISMSGPSAFSASITCLGDLTEVTENQELSTFSTNVRTFPFYLKARIDTGDIYRNYWELASLVVFP